jgi:hypothetical protein
MQSTPQTPETVPGILDDTYHPGATYEERLDLCDGFFRVMRNRRKGPKFIRIGSAVRYGERAVAEWLAEQQTGSAQ